MKNISKIKDMPSIIDNVHESAAYKSYHILEKVKEMLRRNDSKETILEMIVYLEDPPVETMRVVLTGDYSSSLKNES